MFRPLNRHILVQLPEPEKKIDPAFLRPTDYTNPPPKYTVVTVIRTAEDCTLDLKVKDQVVIETSMLQEVNVEEEKYTLILENYVYGKKDRKW
tara:strand:- start:80 stop:358 length:279 start_codon:yes stop_codon:yes gene_type:complete